MRKAVLVIVLLALLALPVSARVGAGMRLGYQSPSFCINLTGDFEITSNIDITNKIQDFSEKFKEAR